MLRVLSSVSVVILLSGCATQFGTRMTHPAHHQVQRTSPVVGPAAPIPPIPVAKETFKQRWLHKFFIKRAIEK